MPSSFNNALLLVSLLLVCSLLVLMTSSSSSSFVNAQAKINHMKLFPRYPHNVYPVSLLEDTKKGNLTLTNADFGPNTTLYIHVDVHHAHIHLENCKMGSLIIHNTHPEEPEYLKGLPAGVTYFWHHDLKHEQPVKINPARPSKGTVLNFKLLNSSMEHGVRFTGELYYSGGNFQIARYHGGPVVMPRVSSTWTVHPPLLSIVNSTLVYKTVPSFRSENAGNVQVDDWVYAEVIRFDHLRKNLDVHHSDEHIHKILPPSILVSGNKIFGGVVYLSSDDTTLTSNQDIIFKNNIMLDGAVVNMRYKVNLTKHGHIEFTNNRFYGRVDPAYTKEGVMIKVTYAEKIIVNNNFFDWVMPLAGCQHSHYEGSTHLVGVEIQAMMSDLVEFKNNVIIIRKAERFFTNALRIEDGFHVEVVNNEIFVNRTKRHVYSLGNWRFHLNTHSAHGLLIEESSKFDHFQRRMGYPQFRHVLVDANTIHMRSIARKMPHRSQWHHQDQHEKLDDEVTDREKLKKQRQKRRDRRRKYHRQAVDKITAEMRDGYLDHMKDAYNDPHHDVETPSGDTYAFKWKHQMPTKAYITNNTFHTYSSYFESQAHGVSIENEDTRTQESFFDFINNRVLIETNHSGQALYFITNSNATHNVIRENEFYCKMAHDLCVQLSAHQRAKGWIEDSKRYYDDTVRPWGQPKLKSKKLHEFEDEETRSHYFGITFRRNKIRYASHMQNFNHAKSSVALFAGGAMGEEDVSIFIQDNDIRGRGVWSLISTYLPRVILENNILKAQGHLGGGFYDVRHAKFLYLHHDQLEKAPLPPQLLDAWHRRTLSHIEWEHEKQHKNIPPSKRKDPNHQGELAESRRKWEEHTKPELHGFLEAQRSHSKSLLVEHVTHSEEMEEENEKGEKIKKTITKVKKIFRPSQSKVDYESVDNLPINNKDASRSFSRSEVEQAQSSAVSLDDDGPLPENVKAIPLTPVFATNLTFPMAGHHHHRRFSIQCVMINGRPLQYEEVKSYLPYEDMDRSELELPHMKNVYHSEDETSFGCPEFESGAAGVPKVKGAAHEDF